jgi:transaldolase
MYSIAIAGSGWPIWVRARSACCLRATKDPKASDVLYIGALAAPNTVNTMPEETLLAFAERGKVGGVLPRDGGDCEHVLADFAKAGIKTDALAARLQLEGAKAFVDSWQDLLNAIESKSEALK